MDGAASRIIIPRQVIICIHDRFTRFSFIYSAQFMILVYDLFSSPFYCSFII